MDNELKAEIEELLASDLDAVAFLVRRKTLERALAQGQWQPIETAPKDGSHVQLYRPEIQFTGYYGGANSGWRINAPGLPAMWPLPTHWQALPSTEELGDVV